MEKKDEREKNKSKSDEKEKSKSKSDEKEKRKTSTGVKSKKENNTKKQSEESKIPSIKKHSEESKVESTKKQNKAKKDESREEKQDEQMKQKNIVRKVVGKPFKFIWNIFVKILTVIIILVSLIIVVQKVTNNQESFLGFRIFRVQTGSMIPKYQVGDVILVKEVDPDKIQIGDDITYEGKLGSMKGLLVTHRVIDIEEENGKRIFHTKGIANNLEDPVISEDQVNGVVQTKMYLLSLICILLNNKYVFYFCGILPLTIYVAFKLFKGKRVKRIERED